jgi:hypothetical protein
VDPSKTCPVERGTIESHSAQYINLKKEHNTDYRLEGIYQTTRELTRKPLVSIRRKKFGSMLNS